MCYDETFDDSERKKMRIRGIYRGVNRKRINSTTGAIILYHIEWNLHNKDNRDTSQNLWTIQSPDLDTSIYYGHMVGKFHIIHL